MSSTTLKLPPDLKKRIAPLARRAEKTPHAWMVDAIRREAELSEQREAFIKDAEKAAAEVDAGGPVYSMKDVHAYLRAKASGKSARRPRPVKVTRRK